MVQEIWQKFNANERMAAIGAGIVVVAWIIGIASPYGIGASTVALLGAIALLAVLYLKYAPNQNINWPAPIPVLLLAISGIVALIALVRAGPLRMPPADDRGEQLTLFDQELDFWGNGEAGGNGEVLIPQPRPG